LATAPIATQTIDLAVAALRTSWLLPNPAKTSATPHSLILSDLWGSENVEDEHEDETKKFKLAVPTSASPGPWLSEGILDCLLSDDRYELTQAEQGRYERLRLAQESFRGYRHDNSKAPAPFLGDNGNTFGNVFTEDEFGSDEEFEERHDSDAEQYSFEVSGPVAGAEDDELNEEDDFETRVDVSEEETEYEVPVNGIGDAAEDKVIDAAYLAWLADDTTEPAFIQVLYHFVHRRMGRTTVATKLWLADEVEDEATEFVLTMLNTLKRMRDGLGKQKDKRCLDGPACHYIYSALANKRKGVVIDLAEHQQTVLTDEYEYSTSEGGRSEDVSRLDDAAERAWAGGRHDALPDDEYREDVLSERKAKFGAMIDALPVELQPVARLYYLQGLTQKQIAEDSEITQGAVSKQLTRVREMAAAYVSKKRNEQNV
jgi:RNA polymerase sigma factor (sigma-70 family)